MAVLNYLVHSCVFQPFATLQTAEQVTGLDVYATTGGSEAALAGPQLLLVYLGFDLGSFAEKRNV